jgi:hypothetical protein
MRVLLIGGVVLFGLVYPVVLLLWTLRLGAQSRLLFAGLAILTAVVIGVSATSLFGQWHVIGVFWPTVYLGAFGLVIVLRVWRGLPERWLPERWGWHAVRIGLTALHAAAWAIFIPPLLQVRAYEGEALRLSPPLKGGDFYVLSGGANNAVNQHSDYAADIGKLNAFGLIATGLFPSDLERYAAFGAEVVAPCAGEVIDVEDGRPNQPPLEPDGEDLDGGNRVIIYCDGHSVHLAHLQAGTVAVELGDQVAVGQTLGAVGNSGNTLLPHLHINAARGRTLFARGDGGVPDDAEPAPFLIDGRFLIKGDRFRN